MANEPKLHLGVGPRPSLVATFALAIGAFGSALVVLGHISASPVQPFVERTTVVDLDVIADARTIAWVRHYYGDRDDAGYGTNAPFLCGSDGAAAGRAYEDTITQLATGSVVARRTGCEQANPDSTPSIPKASQLLTLPHGSVPPWGSTWQMVDAGACNRTFSDEVTFDRPSSLSYTGATDGDLLATRGGMERSGEWPPSQPMATSWRLVNGVPTPCRKRHQPVPPSRCRGIWPFADVTMRLMSSAWRSDCPSPGVVRRSLGDTLLHSRTGSQRDPQAADIDVSPVRSGIREVEPNITGRGRRVDTGEERLP